MIAVDLFSGLGGNTEGARLAGVETVWAGNHWPAAVACHTVNHPHTRHVCQDLQQAAWEDVPDHDLLMGSPACQGHANARGKEAPRHDAARSTAWAVISCAEVKRPAVIVVENVVEFLKWTLYPAWLSALDALGYTVSENIINAADCGVPQSRRRLFLVATRSRAPFLLRRPSEPWRSAASVVNFDAGRWSPVDKPGRAPATLARIAAARAKGWNRFMLAYYGSEAAGRDLSQPMGTITTRDRFALIDGDRMRMVMIDEYRAGMGFRPSYILPQSRKEALHMLGNAVCPPVMKYVVRQVAKHC